MDEFKAEQLKISVDEASKLMGKGHLFVRNSIKNGSMPGAYFINENGHSDFFIPRLAFYKFLGFSDEEAKKMALREQDQNK